METSGYYDGQLKKMADNSKWINLGRRPDGGQCYSRVCGRLVQISDGHIRDGLLRPLNSLEK
eukprot:2821525-Karenia_brevis.AAC.1